VPRPFASAEMMGSRSDFASAMAPTPAKCS
jgi:hypothetical protein